MVAYTDGKPFKDPVYDYDVSWIFVVGDRPRANTPWNTLYYSKSRSTWLMPWWLHT